METYNATIIRLEHEDGRRYHLYLAVRFVSSKARGTIMPARYVVDLMRSTVSRHGQARGGILLKTHLGRELAEMRSVHRAIDRVVDHHVYLQDKAGFTVTEEEAVSPAFIRHALEQITTACYGEDEPGLRVGPAS